ncbi:MAG: nicotinamide mononucleotide transporter [Bacteroidetes bacterium]|nr:nicotinamide mononucleotide transporter [Bacteroidota bacterium]
MHLTEWWNILVKEIAETSLLEWMAVALGVAEVLYAKVNKIWLYPTGIAATLLSIYIYNNAGLYAEAWLNIYYVIMSIYGWWYWIKKKHLPPVKITACNNQDWLITAGITIVGFGILYYLLRNYTTSVVPGWDAWVSATAWAGMWLLAKRKLENWILLNISNAFAVPLLVYKHLLLYAALTVFLFIIAVQGYYKWKKELQQDKMIAPENEYA